MLHEYLLNLQRAKDHNQEHIFTFWNELNESEQECLLKHVESVDFDLLDRLWRVVKKVGKSLEANLQPPDPNACQSFSELRTNNRALLDRYYEIGLEAVRDGKVAVLLLAGGQGTRLGVNYPKGLYKPNLPSNSSLYQLQAEQLLRVKQLAKERFGQCKSTPWYIMTSEHTMETTVDFFKKNGYFGHSSENITFFEQFLLPAFDFDGKILLEKKHKLCLSPDGNGGLYRALCERGILDDMKSRGVQFVQIYCVDNILVKVPDLHFVGYCIARSADCGAQVVQKVEPTEPIGVVGMVDGRYQVVEYSEISLETASLRHNETINGVAHDSELSPTDGDRLVYSHGNICVHFAKLDFLQRISQPDVQSVMRHHVAKKKVPHMDPTTGHCVVPSQPNAIKLEKFVFDVFQFAERFVIWEVPRCERFSPLKNNDQSNKDCPRTSRADLLAYHASLARAAGARFAPVEHAGDVESVLEISPLVSYAGENLEYLKGQMICGINYLELDKKTGRPHLRRVV